MPKGRDSKGKTILNHSQRYDPGCLEQVPRIAKNFFAAAVAIPQTGKNSPPFTSTTAPDMARL